MKSILPRFLVPLAVSVALTVFGCAAAASIPQTADGTVHHVADAISNNQPHRNGQGEEGQDKPSREILGGPYGGLRALLAPFFSHRQARAAGLRIGIGGSPVRPRSGVFYQIAASFQGAACRLPDRVNGCAFRLMCKESLLLFRRSANLLSIGFVLLMEELKKAGRSSSRTTPGSTTKR